MTKHRKTRSQKGGLFGFFESPQDPYAPKKPSSSWFGSSSPTQSAYQSPIQNQSSSWFGSSSPTQSSYQSPNQNQSSWFGSSSPIQPAYQSPIQNQSSSWFGNSSPTQSPIQRQNYFNSPAQSSSYGIPMGGKLRKRTMNKNKTMKGGKGGLGLTYYATPVSGLNVADPTSWQYYANGTNQYSVKGGSKRRHSCKSRKSCKICKTRKQRK
jgi:hypothetical protein